jgi:SecD/SecF fusion protein
MRQHLLFKVLIIIAIVAIAIWNFYPPEKKISLGLDLQGGMHLVLRVDTSHLTKKEKIGAVDRALEILRNRIDQFGVREPVIQRQGKEGIIVQLPGVTERDRAIKLIGQTALLEFKLVSEDPDFIKRALSGKVPEGYELKYLNDKPLLLKKETVLTGNALVNAEVKFDQTRFNQPIVGLRFNSKGARKFARITGENVGKRLAILLDGKVQSAPVIRERIPSGQAVITGRFSLDEARDLAIVLKAGALPAPLKIEEERTVGPLLGKDSISKGVRAAIIGGIVVTFFMIIYYLFAGLIAIIALVLNLILILGALSYFHATLTLPGIAGIVLTIGMAVDANVLIFERIREELRLGKSLPASVDAGYHKAFLTIFDANLTTLITALILFQFGTGPIRGFATTLSIGILASMFTALFVTRVIFDFSISKGLKKLPMLSFFPKVPSFKFIGRRYFAYLFSLSLIATGVICFAKRGENNFGIDFSGGTLQEYGFKKQINVSIIRKALKDIGLGDSLIQQIKGTDRFLIRTYRGETDEILKEFNKRFGKDSFDLLRTESVGPAVGKDLRRKAILALFWSLVAMCIYISIRFKFKFAIAAIIALFHDILISIGAISLTGRELSLPIIAALLTIVGYSINDTIVVFDRIRENMRLGKKLKLPQLVNLSINQTLARTLLTSLTTLFVIISLYSLGGEVINPFAFTLLVGVVIGTYSSVFVASPIVVDWMKKHKKY